MRARQIQSGAGKRRLALSRLVIAMVVAMTLSLMPFAMANGAAMAHGAPAASDMGHCTGSHEAPNTRHGGAISCAVACAAVRPLAPQMMARPVLVRPILASLPNPRLDGIRPATPSPPPRAFSKV